MTLNAKIMEERAQARAEGREEERIKNILTTISILKGIGIQDSKITEQISERFGKPFFRFEILLAKIIIVFSFFACFTFFTELFCLVGYTCM